MKKIFLLWLIGSWVTLWANPSVYSKELKKNYAAKAYAQVLEQAQIAISLGDKAAQAEGYLFLALSTIELYQYEQSASFQVLKAFKKFLKKDRKKTIRSAYPEEVKIIQSYLEVSAGLLAQEKRYVAANYLAKTLRYTLERAQLPLSSLDTNRQAVHTLTRKTGTHRQLLEFAKTKIGIPYRYGGTTDRGYDCSGFTLKVFENAGYQLPRVAMQQANVGEKIPAKQARPGDLVFFSSKQKVDHVGIIVENNDKKGFKMIHASSSRGIRIDEVVDGSYWHKKINSFGRIIKENGKK